MERNEILNYLLQNLKKYGAEKYNYRGTEFIGIKNPYSDNNMAITFQEEEFCMEFTYQSARFSNEDIEDGKIHAEKYLKDELLAVEVFLNGKPLFGGSRKTEGSNFTTVEEFALYYSGENSRIAENLLGFMKNGGVSVKIFSWSGKYDRNFEVAVDGEKLTLTTT